MSRNIIALGALALTGVVLVMPDSSFARGGGFRGGFHGVRAPAIMARHARPLIPRAAFRGIPVQLRNPVIPHLNHGLGHGLARTTVRAPFARLVRRHHGGLVSSWIYPTTTDGEASYIGIPYDPGAAIPVYAPAPVDEQADSPALPPAPRLSATRNENQEACSSERVTVPASEGEREITVVRC